ncbi:hypothetical protein DFH94DRAFT_638974 [Russula ochroleuca]|uniref:Uncharacterized protein n=1 Tax=Russula ochroleuca TaxID=152965 RepID=A0A9P5MQ64_9AGAM|nr:hypothetical protein DFH94DRAFT_638974 [Russula ochroleuca]
MAEEEEAWRVRQHSTSNPSESEDDDDDDDIKPGCYVLDIDNEAIKMRSIWIRAEYIRIYDFLVDYYNNKTRYNGRAPAAVITGQPGIGKSVWIYYALCRCLTEKRPVVWRYRESHGDSHYMFVEEGVYDMGTQFLRDMYCENVVWTLVDADEYRDGVPPELVTHGTPFFVIYTTSPVRERWKRLHKSVFDTVVVMNPWTRSEIHRVAPLHPASPNSEIIDDIYDQFGPTPRLCLEMASDPDQLEAYKAGVRRALKLVTPQYLLKMTHELEVMNMDEVSQKLCQIRRQHIDVKSLACVVPITDIMQSRLAIAMR